METEIESKRAYSIFDETEPKLFAGGLAVDDRGSVTYANDFNFEGVKRFYMVENHRQGFIRAWHGHLNEAKYVFVTSGSILIGAGKIDEKGTPKDSAPKKFILSARQPKILFIPKGYANGFKTLEENTKVMFFSTSTIQESLNDDYRQPYFVWNIWDEDFR